MLWFFSVLVLIAAVYLVVRGIRRGGSIDPVTFYVLYTWDDDDL
jgi:hypothetical protein